LGPTWAYGGDLSGYRWRNGSITVIDRSFSLPAVTGILVTVEDNSFGVPAGWYPDPLGLPQLRWWDAHAWTEHTSDARAPKVAQRVSQAVFVDDAEDFPSDDEPRHPDRNDSADDLTAGGPGSGAPDAPETATSHDREELSAQPLLAMTLRELGAPLTQSQTNQESELLPKPASGHANSKPSASKPSASMPSASMPRASMRSSFAEDDEAPKRVSRHHRTYTAAVWFIAVLPLVQLLTSMALIAFAGLGDNLPLLLVVWIAPYFLVLGLAVYDNLQLRVWGHQHPAGAAWAVLTAPVYLVMRGIRTMRETGRAIAPIAVWLATVLSLVAGVIVLPGLVISLIPQTFSTQIEHSVQEKASTLGAQIELDCPATPPVLIGETFTCDAVEPSTGLRGSIVVSLQRESGWIDWRVEDWGRWPLFG